MKKILFIIIFLLLPLSVGAIDSFPTFPMVFYGNATLDGQPLSVSSSVGVYCNESLIGQVALKEAGVYGYDDLMGQKLIVNENTCSKLVFKYTDSRSLDFKIGTTEQSYNGVFQSGITVKKDLSFKTQSTEPPPSGNTGGGGGGGSGNFIPPVPPLTTTTTTTSPALKEPIKQAVKNENISETCPVFEAGDLIKVIGKPAIYALDDNLNYFYFPDGDVFKSWNADDSYSKYYKSVPQTCFDSLIHPPSPPFHVSYRSGTEIVKSQVSDILYTIGLNNTLYPISTSAVKNIYGDSYKPKVIGLSEWPYYMKDKSVTLKEDSIYPGMVLKVENKYYFSNQNKELQEITPSGMIANRIKSSFIRTLSATAIIGLTKSETITSEIDLMSKRIFNLIMP